MWGTSGFPEITEIWGADSFPMTCSGLFHLCKLDESIWAAAWKNQQNDMCAQRRLRSALASAQSDQSLRSAVNRSLRTQCFFMRTATTLIRLSRCPGWSESSPGAKVILFVFVMRRLICRLRGVWFILLLTFETLCASLSNRIGSYTFNLKTTCAHTAIKYS